MSTSSIGLSMSTLRPALPIVSASLYTLGFLTGLYSLSDPVGGAKAFGIMIPASRDSKSSTTSSSTDLSPTEKAYIRVHGIRNVTNGVASLGVLALIQFSSLCRDSSVAAEAVRKCIGLSLVVGSMVGFTDGWILKRFAEEGGVSAEAEELAAKQSQGHAILAAPICALGVAWLYA